MFRSSSLAPQADNLNTIFLYNKQRNGLVDLPDTGSHLLVQLYPSIGSGISPVTLPVDHTNVNTGAPTYITASRHDKGIYKATFSCANTGSTFHDVWQKYVPNNTAQGTFTYTGTVADLNNGVTFTIIDAAGTSHEFTFDTSSDSHTVTGQNSTIGVQTAKSGTDTTAIASQVNAAINASSFFTSTVDGNIVTIKQKLSGTDGNRTSSQSAGNVGYTVTNLAIPSSGIYTTLVTGSGFTLQDLSAGFYYDDPKYNIKITNLKPAYSVDEKITLRVYMRNKNFQPNVYTVASNTAPVFFFRNGFYRLDRVADNHNVIAYSTGSTPSYSSLSYDVSGSFFDLDMSILEPNYLYQISFLQKDGNNYIEQKEKFKFRVDP